MEQHRKDCVWCGSEVNSKAESHPEPHFCPECHTIYESEGHRSLHPVEMRQPHND